MSEKPDQASTGRSLLDIQMPDSQMSVSEMLDLKLQALIAQRERGIDIAPAQCHRFEGYLHALLDSGVTADSLLECCRQRLPADCSIEFDSSRDEFSLSMPQAIAPVYPSTHD